MAFLARCPDCGKFQVCVLAVEDAINLKCQACGGVFAPVSDGAPGQENVDWSLGTTMAGYEFEPPKRSKDNLVVVAELPSVYPNQRPPKSRNKKRRQKRTTSRVKTPQPVPPQPEAPAAAPTGEAAVDPTTPKLEPPASAPTAANLYRLPPPEGSVTPVTRTEEDEVEEYGKFELNRISMLALFTLIAGLLLAALTSLNYLPLLMIVLTLVLGIFAVRSSLNEGRQLLVPGATLGVAAVVLIVSITAPGMIGPSATTPGGALAPAIASIQVIPHPQFAGDPNVRTAEWTDASKASLIQGDMRVEIVEAHAGRSGLSVRIRLQRIASVPGISGVSTAGLNWNDKVSAALLNRGGRRFEEQSATLENKSQGTHGPGQPNALDVVLVFPEVAAREGVRLELPAAAWGGSGTLKFAIPVSMIKRKSP